MRLDRRLAAAAGAAAGATLAAVGTFLIWFRIEIGGVLAPGGEQTGWEGRDGRTVLAGAVVAAGAAAVLLLARWPERVRVALLATGAITSVVAVAAIVDASGKAEQVQARFGIAAGRVVADVGYGLWLVAAAGVIELAAGLLAPPERPVTRAQLAGSRRAPASSRRRSSVISP